MGYFIDVFFVGMNEGNGMKTVGFRYGAYAEGSTSIGPVDELPHVPQRMKEVVKVNTLLVLCYVMIYPLI